MVSISEHRQGEFISSIDTYESETIDALGIMGNGNDVTRVSMTTKSFRGSRPFGIQQWRHFEAFMNINRP